MNISTANSLLQTTKLAPAAQSVTGDIAQSVNLTPTASAQVNISGRSADTGTAENPTYQRPANNQVTDTAPASPNSNIQPSDKIDAQQKEGTKEEAENSTAQEESDTSGTVPAAQEQYSDLELKQISSLKLRDSEVLTHERAHAAVGGQYAGSPSYSYQTGPDGVKYAVGGEVSIDTSKVPNDPQATLQKAQQIKAAALAPAEPSGQDRRVAAKADQMAAQARADILQEIQADNGGAKRSASISRAESSVPEHLTGVQYLEKGSELSQKLNNRIEQISSLYQNSSVTKSSSTFQTQI